jgi:site-specific recombinase XerD
MSPLRRRMIEDMQIRNLTPNTQRVYVEQIVRFTAHFRKSPDRLGPAEIRAYLLHLATNRRLAASSIIVTVSALRFFYTVTLKRVLSQSRALFPVGDMMVGAGAEEPYDGRLQRQSL